MSLFQAYNPNELLVKDEPIHPEFRPGDMVSHESDGMSYGMVVSRRRTETGSVECNVLWSRAPAPKSQTFRPRHVTVLPETATWTRTVTYNSRRMYDAYSPASFFAPNDLIETFDGEEAFEPGTISPDEVRGKMLRASKTNMTRDHTGVIRITYREVPRHELPEYVLRTPPSVGAAHYSRGRLMPW